MEFDDSQRTAFALLVLASTAAVAAMLNADVPEFWLVLWAALLPVAFRVTLLGGGRTEPGHVLKSLAVWRAMRRGEIVLHYQPKIDIGSGDFTGVEALARWDHPRRGLLSPAEWLPATEARWLERRFCAYVLRAAVRQAARWRSQGRDFTVCVNVSQCCFAHRGLPRLVRQLLDDCELPPVYLCLELTEEALALSPRTVAVAEQLTAMGVVLALDDFGIGHSSMERLVGLPLNELKIDRRFVSRMVSSDRNSAVVRAAIGLAHSLGMVVTAEGVETPEVMRSLEMLGCDVAQGFLFSPAMPPEELDGWLARTTGDRFHVPVRR
jgi:EAL domain-containing protein (putative c-di-GMP-specific phosphodiesterase class I)